jgi:hypothetical protein
MNKNGLCVAKKSQTIVYNDFLKKKKKQAQRDTLKREKETKRSKTCLPV